MYKPDDEKIEEVAEDTGVLEENDISDPAAPIDTPPEAPEDPPVQESE